MQVEVNNIALHYVDEGQGKPVVLIHGFPFDHHLWDHQVNILSQTNRVIVPDLRGFGESDHPDEIYTMTQYAADIIALLDLLQIEKAVMAGLSMGGYVALAIADQFPERMDGLILSNTRSAKDTAAVRQNRYNTIEKINYDGTEFLIEEMIQKVLSKKTLKEKPEVVEFVEKMMRRQDAVGIKGALAGMAQRKDRTFILNALQVPVIVINGKKDSLISVIEAKRMARELSMGHLEVIPASGHLSNLVQPEKYNEILKRFIESCEVVEPR
ncbi:MAG TPA: alpha/beta hydrolase [bacterium]|nr:alpha/beta hydrolase [bacterium]